MQYVIYDSKNTGFAVNSLMEGWIFTTLLSAATRFDSESEAKEVRKKYYGTCVGLQINSIRPPDRHARQHLHGPDCTPACG
jgi:hypothetical protein